MGSEKEIKYKKNILHKDNHNIRDNEFFVSYVINIFFDSFSKIFLIY